MSDIRQGQSAALASRASSDFGSLFKSIECRENLTCFHIVADRNIDGCNRACLRCGHFDFHFHGFQRDDRLARLNRLADGCVDL